MSYLSVARSAIIAKGAAISGIRYTYPRMPDTIAAAPALVLGQYTASVLPGDRERTTFDFELTLYVQLLGGDNDQAIAAADDLIDAIQDAYAQGITLGQTGQTTQCVVTGFTANTWVTISESIYLTVVFALVLSATRQRGYTA